MLAQELSTQMYSITTCQECDVGGGQPLSQQGPPSPSSNHQGGQIFGKLHVSEIC